MKMKKLTLFTVIVILSLAVNLAIAQERTYYDTGELKIDYKKSNGKLNGITKEF